MLFNTFLFKFKYFYPNSNIFIFIYKILFKFKYFYSISDIIMLFTNSLIEFKCSDAFWRNSILINILFKCSAKFQSTREVSYQPAFM